MSCQPATRRIALAAVFALAKSRRLFEKVCNELFPLQLRIPVYLCTYLFSPLIQGLKRLLELSCYQRVT
jgi:hypothetical protein